MLMGVPILEYLFDDIAVTSIVYAVTIPLYNILAVVACEKGKSRFASTVRKVAINPIVISTLVGIAFNLSGLMIPEFIHSSVDSLAATGSTLALITLGGLFNFKDLENCGKKVLFVSFLRLIILPSLFLYAAYSIGLRNVELAMVLIVFGCPVPPTAFTLAKEMGGDSNFASSIVLASSLLSSVTLFFWIYFLKFMQLI